MAGAVCAIAILVGIDEKAAAFAGGFAAAIAAVVAVVLTAHMQRDNDIAAEERRRNADAVALARELTAYLALAAFQLANTSKALNDYSFTIEVITGRELKPLDTWQLVIAQSTAPFPDRISESIRILDKQSIAAVVGFAELRSNLRDLLAKEVSSVLVTRERALTIQKQFAFVAKEASRAHDLVNATLIPNAC